MIKIYIIEENSHYPREPGGTEYRSIDVDWYLDEDECEAEVEKRNRNLKGGYHYYAMREEELK